MLSVITRSTGGKVRDRAAFGVVLGGVAGLAYAVTIVIGRTLAKAGVPTSVGLGVRFTTAGALLAVGLVVQRRPLLPKPGERLAAFLLGAVGYSVQSALFYLALGHGTAAAVALLFYVYPAILVALEAVSTRRRPRRSTVGGLLLAVAGTGAIAAGSGRVHISAAGVGYALGAAGTFAAYVMLGDRYMRTTDAWTTSTWVASGAGVALLGRAALDGWDLPGGHGWQLAGYGLATAAAFTCMFAALRRLGPGRTGVVLTTEALFAVVLGAVVLHERIGAVEAAAGVGILAGAVVVALTPDAVSEPRVPLE